MTLNTKGLTPAKVLRFGGQIDWDDPVQIPNGLAILCQNMSFLAESVKTRWGLRATAQLPGLDADPTGVDVLTVLGTPQVPSVNQQSNSGSRASQAQIGKRVLPTGSNAALAANTQVMLVFTDAGELLLELPAGTGNFVVVDQSRMAPAVLAILKALPASAVMQTTKAYNRIHCAFTDLQKGLTPVMVLDAATGQISVLPQNPIGAVWKANTFYEQGDILTPTTNSAVWFRRTVTGYSGAAEPNWPNPAVVNPVNRYLSFFTPGYVPVYAQAQDGAIPDAWEEWTMGFPSYLPAPGSIASAVFQNGGTIAAGLDVYVGLAYCNDLGESLWTTTKISNSAANSKVLIEFDTAQPAASGPPMPRWLMSVLLKGTVTSEGVTDGNGTPIPEVLHWPTIDNCLRIYVAAVAHGNAAPTQYYLYETTTADAPIVINSIPNSGPTFAQTVSPTAAISTQQFMGEGGTRNAILLRQDTMGNQSPVDPNAVIPVSFPGALTESNVEVTVSADGLTLYLVLEDVTQYAPGSQVVVRGAQQRQGGATTGTALNWNGTYTVSSISLGSAIYGNPALTISTPFPGGTLVCKLSAALTPASYFTASADLYCSGLAGHGVGATNLTLNAALAQGELTNGMQLIVFGDPTTYSVTNTAPVSGGPPPTLYTLAPVDINPALTQNLVANNPPVTILAPNSIPTCSVGINAGPCPVAVVPPGSEEGVGYSYDILAFTVAGIGPAGPFTYLAAPNPQSAFTASVIEEIGDGLGNAYAQLSGVNGLSAGEVVSIVGWTGGNAGLNGQRTIATVASSGVATCTFPEPSSFNGTQSQATSPTLTVVQALPTMAVAGTGAIQLQFDDTTLPDGIDVTDNLLLVAIPPATDLCYLPSIDRMAYVSDQEPTTAIFSETSFLGEVDGENDVLAIEQTDGAILVGLRELLNGMIIALKESGGYQVIPTADVPARWGVNRVWGNKGPWSGRNIATGRDAGSKLPYLIFVDPDSGVYRYPPILGQGDIDWLSKELSGANNQDSVRQATWDRVNRAAGETIQVVIDDVAKEIKIAVPLDGATTPSHVLTMSYFNGWKDPLMLTLSGEWVPARDSRRWNLDPIPTRCMALVERTLAVPIDQRVNFRQLLLGTPASMNGGVCAMTMMQPGAYDDLGKGYVSKYRPAYSREVPNQLNPAGNRLLRFSGLTGTVVGKGRLSITPVSPSPEFMAQAILVSLDEGEAEVPGSAPVTHLAEGFKGDSEFLTCEFSNGGTAGAWFQLMEYTAWYHPQFPTR